MSQKRIKQRLSRKDAVGALRGLENVKQLPDLLKQALEVNKTLVEENSHLNDEVSRILEDHEDRIETLERIIKRLVAGTPYSIPKTDDFSLDEVKTELGQEATHDEG